MPLFTSVVHSGSDTIKFESAMTRSALQILRRTIRTPESLRQSPLHAPSGPLSTLPLPSRPRTSIRAIYSTSPQAHASRPPKSRDRGPKSEEDTQTDFGALDVLRNTAAPATSIDACAPDGFALNNGTRVSGSGLLLVGGEAFRWRPWLSTHHKEGTVAEGGVGDDAMTGKLQNAKGQWDVPPEAWGLLDIVFPKPGA